MIQIRNLISSGSKIHSLVYPKIVCFSKSMTMQRSISSPTSSLSSGRELWLRKTLEALNTLKNWTKKTVGCYGWRRPIAGNIQEPSISQYFSILLVLLSKGGIRQALTARTSPSRRNLALQIRGHVRLSAFAKETRGLSEPLMEPRTWQLHCCKSIHHWSQR
jgi:hypothetical protein